MFKLKTAVSRWVASFAPSPRTYRGLMYAAAHFQEVDVDWTPGSERVLVLAPHMDDEVLGCGGALALHRRAGAQITIVFLTDGRQGSSALLGLSGEARRAAEDELVRTRKLEAAEALRSLDIDDIVHLDALDGALAQDRTAPHRLREVLQRTRPEIVYLPSFLEQHPDHRAASAVLLGAAGAQRQDFMCHAFEVWTPLYPNCLVGIDAVVDAKRGALAHYRSQLVDIDFEHGVLGLNAFRAMSRPRPGRRYAEAYCALSLADYARSYRRFIAGRDT